MCGFQWSDRHQFLSDSTIIINGYAADFEDLKLGLLFFTHDTKNCGTTITIYAEEFWDMYEGKMFEVSMRGKEGCPGYCLHEEQLERCEQYCECAYVRGIIQIIKQYEKK